MSLAIERDQDSRTARQPIGQPAVGYLRRSTDRQEQSIGDQKHALEVYAQDHGFEILDFYVDDAISGTSADERKAFLQLIKDASADNCPFRYVLVYDIKRFGRLDNDEAGYYRFQLRRAGVEVIYTSEGFNGDETDDLLRPVKQWQARQESRELSKVTIRGLLSRSGEGWWSGGMPPYGYDLTYWSGDGNFLMVVRYDHDLNKLILDEDGNVTRVVPRGESLMLSKRDRCKLVPSTPERVEVLRNIFTWYAYQGLGSKGIADRLNQAGISSPRGGHWSSMHQDKWAMTTVKDILENPAYVGDAVWNRQSFAKFHRIEQGRAVPRRVTPGAGPTRNRQEDWIVVKDAHPALISRTLFLDAKKKREARKLGIDSFSYRVGQGANSPFLLSGLINCLHCGHRWHGYTTHKGRKRNDGTSVKSLYYACGGYVSKGKSCCQRSLLDKETAEEWVFEQIGRIIPQFLGRGGEAKLREMIEQELAGDGRFDGSQLATVRQHKRDAESAIENLLDNLTAANREFVDRRIQKLRDEIAACDQEEGSLLELQSQEQQASALAQEAMLCVRDFDRVQAEGTVDEKKQFVRAFLHRIDFDPASRKGTAYFWGVPDTGGGVELATTTTDRATMSDGDDDTRYIPATANLASDTSGSRQGAKSSLPIRLSDARYIQKRSASQGSASSLSMVAGAGSSVLQKMRVRCWIWDLPFERLGRAVDAMWEDAELRFSRPDPTLRAG